MTSIKGWKKSRPKQSLAAGPGEKCALMSWEIIADNLSKAG